MLNVETKICRGWRRIWGWGEVKATALGVISLCRSTNLASSTSLATRETEAHHQSNSTQLNSTCESTKDLWSLDYCEDKTKVKVLVLF